MALIPLLLRVGGIEMSLQKSDYLSHFFVPGGLDVFEDWDELERTYGFVEFQIPLETALDQVIKFYKRKGLLRGWN